MIKRKEYKLRGGKIIDREEYHDGRYGAPGLKRAKRKKLTKEQMRIINLQNKSKRCRRRMLEYFDEGDIFATWTYEVRNRPSDMQNALKDFQKAMRYVRREFKKRGYEVFWIRNIERGTKGAWHIHLIINEIGDTTSIITKAWVKGGTWSIEIKNSKYYDEDFTKLSNYMTKDEHTTEEKKDGKQGKPRLSEANYNTSRNMPLPEPKIDKLRRWKEEPRARKGYYIAKIHEGINPVTGYRYRRYTMIEFDRSERKGNRHEKYINSFEQLFVRGT